MARLVRTLWLYDGDEEPYKPKSGAEMVSGKAVGGPKDGIKLTAPISWDGIVYPIQRGIKPVCKPYPGKYRWKEATWRWEPCNTDKSTIPNGSSKRSSL